MHRVYLDAATVAPLHPAAREAFAAALEDGWADPSRLYAEARRARQLLDAARGAVAELFGVQPESIFFAASGTSAAHASVVGMLQGRSQGRFIHSSIEHSAVMHAREWYERGGGVAESVGVDRYGRVEIEAIRNAVKLPDARLVALIAASHEVGTLQPLPEVWTMCREMEVPLYADMAALVGNAPIPSTWDIASASARKWGGPGGVGIVAVKPGVRWRFPSSARGEFDSSAGGNNVPWIVAAAAALRARVVTLHDDVAHMNSLLHLLREEIPQRVSDCEVYGWADEMLPSILMFSCRGIDGEVLLHALNARGFAVNTGSACSASTVEPSHVLKAMRVSTEGSIRVSLHPDVTKEEILEFLHVLPSVVQQLRE